MQHDQTSASISVIIPAYNSEKTISKCVQSILGQSLLPQEILVYDDCSSDRTFALLQDLAERHKSIRVFQGHENKGAGQARSALLQEARSEFFAFLDADDVWYPDKLQLQMEVIARENLDICICGYTIFGEDGERLGERLPPPKISYASMHLANWIPTSMAIVRADLIGTRKMPDIRRRQDYAYWLNLFKQNPQIKAGGTSEILGSYLRSSASLSSSKITNLKFNFRMFRDVMKYSVVKAGLCVTANVLFRLFRK